MECIRSLLGTKTGDFITAVDEKSIIVVKELASEEGYQEMEKTAKQILNVLPAEKQEVSEKVKLTIWSFGQSRNLSSSFRLWTRNRRRRWHLCFFIGQGCA